MNNNPRINIFNRQRKLALDRTALLNFCQILAARMQLEREFSICLVSDRKMRLINRQFAGKNRATDVLSFPNHDEVWEDDPYAGDILVSVETANRQKKADLEGELKVLCLHGLLHLLGYDHETDSGEMDEIEGQLQEEFGLK